MEDEEALMAVKGLVDDAFRGASLSVRQRKASEILSISQGMLSEEDFKKLEAYIHEKLEN